MRTAGAEPEIMRMVLVLSLLAVGCAAAPELEQLRASTGRSGDPVQLDAGAQAPDAADARQPDSAPAQSDGSAPDTSPVQPDAQQADQGGADTFALPADSAPAADTQPRYPACPADDGRTFTACTQATYWKGFFTGNAAMVKDGYQCAFCYDSGVSNRPSGCTVAGPLLCVLDCNECVVPVRH